MSTDPETALLEELIAEITALLPDPWRRARLDYRVIGDNETIQLSGEEPGKGFPSGIHTAGYRVPHTAIPELLRRHREVAYDPEHGAWAWCTYRLWNDTGKFDWGVSAKRPSEFEPGVFDFSVPISPADVATELRRFPCPDDRLPDWMRHLRDLHHAAQNLTFTPRREDELAALLPPGTEQLFTRARSKLADFVPGTDALRIGALEEGCWTITHADGVWFALTPGGEPAPYAQPHHAVAHAMAGIMADARMEINSALLDHMQIITLQKRPRDKERAWLLGEDGRKLSASTTASPRPSGPGPYIALNPLHNRPAGHFVCFPGPVPHEGPFISVHDLYTRLATPVLPEPKSAPQPAPEPAPPAETLPVGTEVDAYGDPDGRFVYEIGTPYLLRGLWGPPTDHAYHRYRVLKPIHARTGLFAPGPLGDDPPPPTTGMGFHLGATINDLIASGHLVEIPTGRPENELAEWEGNHDR